MKKLHRNRSAFTVMELIFVIVIIGILAIAAIPRLSATRMDARLTIRAHSIAVAAHEIAAYAASKGKTTSDLAQMSNSIQNMLDKGEATSSSYRIDIKVEGVSDCVILKIDGAGTNVEVLKLEHGNSPSSTDCDTLRSFINTEDYPIPLRGKFIVY